MRFLFFSLFFLISVFSYSQSNSTSIKLDENVSDQILRIDCEHGHICCESDCHCCPRLKEQKYDTIQVYHCKNGKIRYTVTGIDSDPLSSAELYPNYYLFVDSLEKKGSKYYMMSPPYESFKTHITTMLMAYTLSDTFCDGQRLVADQFLQFHLIDPDGNRLKILDYKMRPLTDSLFKVSIMSHGVPIYGLMNSNGKLLHRGFGYSRISELKNGKYIEATETTGKVSILNINGTPLFDRVFSKAEVFLGNGLLKIRNERGWQLFDLEEDIMLSDTFDEIGNNIEGMLLVQKDKKMGFINKNGAYVIQAKYDMAHPFSNGRARVYQNEKWGFVDKLGNLIVPHKYDRVNPFGSNRAGVVSETKNAKNYSLKWGLIDINGKYIVRNKYDEIDRFYNGYAKVNINGKGDGLIDTSGNVIVDCKYDIEGYGVLYPPICNNVIFVREYFRKKIIVSLLNIKTNEKIKLNNIVLGTRAQVTNKLEWLPYYVVTNKNRKKGMVDTNGNYLIPVEYNQIYALDGFNALVINDKNLYLYDYLNRKRKHLCKGELLYVPFQEYIAIKQTGEETVYFDFSGNKITVY